MVRHMPLKHGSVGSTPTAPANFIIIILIVKFKIRLCVKMAPIEEECVKLIDKKLEEELKDLNERVFVVEEKMKHLDCGRYYYH